ncbi:hypothetical protein B0H13DRAFT_2313348 [Mycena leptocephala]|nr:hypothetical protein B0H13DRAFT_2313348 [Mycena leptocephala]
MPASSIPAFTQVDLLLAEFFASIAITMIALSARQSPPQYGAPVLWHALLLLGILNTVFCYRSVKQAARGSNTFDFRKSSIAWIALVFSWAIFVAPPQDGIWRTCLANTPSATLIVPFILAQVVLTRHLAWKFGYLEVRQ